MNGPEVSGRQPHIADADAPGSGLLTLTWGWLIIFQASPAAGPGIRINICPPNWD
ncbi:hypothetical protein KAM334_13000 [Aeromonas caviae]|nr:hypothetical protein KAM334_13000 [Aeromonas caviae]